MISVTHGIPYNYFYVVTSIIPPCNLGLSVDWTYCVNAIGLAGIFYIFMSETFMSQHGVASYLCTYVACVFVNYPNTGNTLILVKQLSNTN